MSNIKEFKNFSIEFGSTNMIEYDYDIVYECEKYECDSICRCGKIENIIIENVNQDVSHIRILKCYRDKGNRKRTKPYKRTDLEKYCLDRLLRIYKTYDKSLYSLGVCSGYYGEEIDGFTFENHDALLTSINNLLELQTDIEKIKFVLNEEYSYLLEELVDLTTVESQLIDMNKILINREYLGIIKRNSAIAEKHKFEPKIPIGIVKKSKLNEYKLIDGYHRYLSMMNDSKTALFYCVS